MGAKTVLFTFDYELFLGAQSGKPRECMIDPTDRLLRLFGDFGFKAIFFVDAVYLMRLQDAAREYPQASRDLSDILKQLDEIVRQGHTLFPHIHAHWLDAEYNKENNEWSLQNTRYYRFASLDTEQQKSLFAGCMQVIEMVTGKMAVDQRIDSYRAGGWSIQPFGDFKPYFLRYGITNDWSVIPGKYHLSDAQFFDFRKAPTGAPVYRFEEDPCQEASDGQFTEWTISTIGMTPFEKWFNFKISGMLRRFGKKEAPKGSTVSSVAGEVGDDYGNGNIPRTIASFEGLNPFILRKYLAAIRKESYFQFISHPKLLSSFDFSMIRKLFLSLKTKYDIQTDYRKTIV